MGHAVTDQNKIRRLEEELAEVDMLVSVHRNSIDPNPRSQWPKGSILEKAISRLEKRLGTKL